jgi:uncharacterized protein (TIGR02588 family)
MAKRPRQVPLVEWVIGAVSAAIFVGTIGFLLYEVLQPGPDAPQLTVTVLRVHESNGSYVVDVSVRNSSRAAAADVHIAGVVPSQGGGSVRGEARIDYVPGLSTRRATLVFSGVDPGKDPPVQVVGYTRP